VKNGSSGRALEQREVDEQQDGESPSRAEPSSRREQRESPPEQRRKSPALTPKKGPPLGGKETTRSGKKDDDHGRERRREPGGPPKAGVTAHSRRPSRRDFSPCAGIRRLPGGQRRRQRSEVRGVLPGPGGEQPTSRGCGGSRSVDVDRLVCALSSLTGGDLADQRPAGRGVVGPATVPEVNDVSPVRLRVRRAGY